MTLAWVGVVESIHSIENADRLESAVVFCGDGGRWRGVVKKGDFNPGDICNVFLQDALIPKTLTGMEFMEKSGWRVRMSRFRGSPSECLITKPYIKGDLGTDISRSLGVEKWERPTPACLGGQVLGSFPSFIPKTDEPNFQSVPRIVERLAGVPVHLTVKYNGSSGTVYKLDGKFGVCSRNLELKESEGNAFWGVVRSWGIEENMPDGWALQFEVYGEGIQGNDLGIKGIAGAAFSLYHIGNRQYQNPKIFRDFCERLNVPMVESLLWDEKLQSIDGDYLLSLSEGLYPSGKQREGIVIRPMLDVYTEDLRRISVKVLNLLHKEK